MGAHACSPPVFSQQNVSFPTCTMPAEKRRSVLGEGKYSPSVNPVCKSASAQFLVSYKTLVNEPDPGVRRGLCKVSRSQFREQGGLTSIYQ